MTGQATSLGVVRYTPGAWRAFATFLRQPVLPERVTGIRLAAISGMLKLFALDLLLMGLLIGLLAVARVFGFQIPENAIDKLQLGPAWLAAIIVVAPIFEELIFRGWLSGRAGHVAAVVALIAGVGLPLISGPGAHPILLLGSLAIALVLAAALAFWLRHRPEMPFFARHFAWFYFASALLFASAHLMNYTQGAALILLPLVVPQLIAGLIFGYARVTYGLWSDMLLHMMHNAALIGLVIIGRGI